MLARFRAAAHTVASRGHAVSRIGALNVYVGRNAKPAAADRVFAPARQLVNRQDHCKLWWPRLHLKLDYWSYGVVTGPACGDTFLQVAYLGRSWQTAAGLRVGATVSQLEKIYHRARREGNR